jgi:hypothetical protein
VRVPDEAGSGMATIKLSFTGWNDAQIAPITIQVKLAESTETAK